MRAEELFLHRIVEVFPNTNQPSSGHNLEVWRHFTDNTEVLQCEQEVELEFTLSTAHPPVKVKYL